MKERQAGEPALINAEEGAAPSSCLFFRIIPVDAIKDSIIYTEKSSGDMSSVILKLSAFNRKIKLLGLPLILSLSIKRT